jgi:hypothetical protein
MKGPLYLPSDTDEVTTAEGGYVEIGRRATQIKHGNTLMSKEKLTIIAA